MSTSTAGDQHQAALDAVLHPLRGLLVATRLWARRQPLDWRAVEVAQDEAIVALHRLHVASIPVYRRVAERDGLVDVDDAAVVAEHLMLTADVFKSYDEGWLAGGDFEAMTAWLGTLFTRRPRVDLDGVVDVGSWRARLRADEVFLTYSSGTSGRPSFVARDRATLGALRGNGALYSPLAATPGPSPAPAFDCLALTQEGLGLGIQAVARGLVEQADRSHHLALPPAGVPPAAIDQAWDRAVAFLRTAAAADRPMSVIGTPALVDTLCARVGADAPAPLGPGSWVVTGGGWKGRRPVDPTELRRRVDTALGVGPERTLDVYGAAELNCYLLRCPHGRYHVPPLLRVVVLDDHLVPGRGHGLLGFLDPFAFSHPGFVVPGDVGRVVRGACRCGLEGWAVEEPIERAPAAGARGCATAVTG